MGAGGMDGIVNDVGGAHKDGEDCDGEDCSGKDDLSMNSLEIRNRGSIVVGDIGLV